MSPRRNQELGSNEDIKPHIDMDKSLLIRNPRLYRSLLLIAILLAFGLRVLHLDDFGFWLDEGLTPLRSGYSVPDILSNRITIQDGLTRDTHPPFYYLLIHFSRSLLGESDFGYRLPSVLASVLLVPVLYQLARQIDGRKTALIAAFLAAVNPLQVWYAQEARMYTTLVLLAAAATLALWKALSQRGLNRWLFIYVLLSGLAFYTHYTAAFLIAAQGLFWIWLLWRKGHRRLLIGVAALAIIIALPLLPFTVPRLFTGAEASYFHVSPLIMLQDVVHGFGLGQTVDAGQPGIKLLDLGALVLLLAGLIGPHPTEGKARLRRLVLITYLMAAVLGLMAGSLIKPMYMGARHIMIGSPAFLLLAARGLLCLPRRPLFMAPLAGLAVVLCGPVVSLCNLYNDPDYAKDDVRALIQHVEHRAGNNDLLLYNDAILLPIHWHYQQRDDVSATALPIYPHNSGPDTEQQLQALAEKYERIWFIRSLPADGRDNKLIVRGWIEDHLVPVEKYSAHGRNMEVQVTAYTTTPVLVDTLPADGLPLDLQMDGLPPLRGLRFDFVQPIARPSLWLDLFWQRLGSLTQLCRPMEAPGKQLRFALRGPDGKLWLDESQPFWSVDWSLPQCRVKDESVHQTVDAGNDPGDSLVRLSYALPIPGGTPPGEYELILLVWDDVSGAALTEWQSLAHVELAPIPGPGFATTCPLYFDNGLDMLKISFPDEKVRPGHTLPLAVYWRARTPPADTQYQLDVIGPMGEIVLSQIGTPGASWLSADTWPLDTVVLELTGLYFAPETAPGNYRLRWRLSSGGKSVPVRPAWRPWRSESITFGQVEVQPWPEETELPADVNLLEAQFGPAIELYGYELESEPLQQAGYLDLTLFWQALDVPDRSYYAFVHLVLAGEESIISQVDRIPVDWLRPTNGWRRGEVLTDSYALQVPEELAPGAYHLYVGLFDPQSSLRLPVTYQGKVQPDDRLLLMTVNHE